MYYSYSPLDSLEQKNSFGIHIGLLAVYFMGIMFWAKLYSIIAETLCIGVAKKGIVNKNRTMEKPASPNSQSLCISCDFFPLFSTARYEKTHFPNETSYVKSKKEQNTYGKKREVTKKIRILYGFYGNTT